MSIETEAALDLAGQHYLIQKYLWTEAASRARKLWATVDPANITASWAAALPAMVAIVTTAQAAAAADSQSFVVNALAVQGIDTMGSEVAPSSFAGVASDGRPLVGALASPAYTALSGIGSGNTAIRSLSGGLNHLMLATQTQVADAGRVSAGVTIASRHERISYVRMLEPPSCARCVVLAGKVYHWNKAFLRHPGCDCRNIPTVENVADDMTTDPYAYFKSLSPDEKARIFTKDGAKAIDDGADIFQVVNSRSGMKYAGESADGSRRGQKAGAFTKAGTVRGNFIKNTEAGAATNGKRLTPEAIYRLNGDNRAAAIRDLERYGYILPGGQNPLGSIVGQREGYGALGGGGRRKAASQAVLDARAAGIRDPASRYTMTAAERRLFDAKARYDQVQQGINPYGNPTMTKKVAYFAPPLTPAIKAAVEKDYHRWLATNGEVFIK